MSILEDIAILLLGYLHVYLAPYTKVEESFNLHAVHDVLMYGVGTREGVDCYDHFKFPGPVPRTFIGSLVLAGVSYPVIWVLNLLGFVTKKYHLQVIVRLTLSTLNALSLSFLRRSLSRRFGPRTSWCFTLLTLSQFHVPFWMSRTIPNMYAFGVVNVVSGIWVGVVGKGRGTTRSTNIERAIALLVFTAVVLRAEVVLLLGPVVLQSLASGYVGFWRVVWVGMGVGLVSIATTVAVDSFFWRELVWPEAKGILFNVVEGNSSQWGTSPIYTYILLLLNLLLSSLPFSIFGCILDPKIREMLLPYVAFVGIISFLGHKEWRFVVYVVPVVNVGAARVGETTQRNESKSKKSTLLSFIFYGMILLNVLKTVVTTVASIGNYPGGEALRRFDELIVPNGKPYHVHIANLAAQSGASLFLQEHAPPFPPSSLMFTTMSTTHNTHIPWYLLPTWVSSPNAPYTWTVYDKTENQTIDDLSRNTDITHLISETSPVEMRSRMRIWKVV
ncbi:alpha-1,6-mannosyltransferase subunit, partial [Lentinula raphanica]